MNAATREMLPRRRCSGGWKVPIMLRRETLFHYAANTPCQMRRPDAQFILADLMDLAAQWKFAGAPEPREKRRGHRVIPDLNEWISTWLLGAAPLPASVLVIAPLDA